MYVFGASVNLNQPLTKLVIGFFQGCRLYRFEKVNELIDELDFCVWVVDATEQYQQPRKVRAEAGVTGNKHLRAPFHSYYARVMSGT